ncbi:MAG: response regulator [Dehalococcoidales bacterium]
MTNHEYRILIVDDEAAIRRLLRQKLTKSGYQCEEAGNSDEALEKMKTFPADLIMLDMKMPGKSGMELLPELKANYPDTAVIMATAVAEADLAIQCMKLGADDYITKPFNLDEITSNIEKTLDKKSWNSKSGITRNSCSKKWSSRLRKSAGFFLVPSNRWFLPLKPRINIRRAIRGESRRLR